MRCCLWTAFVVYALYCVVSTALEQHFCLPHSSQLLVDSVRIGWCVWVTFQVTSSPCVLLALVGLAQGASAFVTPQSWLPFAPCGTHASKQYPLLHGWALPAPRQLPHRQIQHL